MSESNFISKLSKLSGLDKEDVLSRLEELDVDDAMAALDAAGNDNAEEAKRLLNKKSTEEKDENDAKDININPLFNKKSIDNPSKEKPVEDKDFGEEIFPSIGDPVMTRDGRTGTIKIPNGPKETSGVMIDGKMTMVKRRDLKIDEHVLGMTPMTDLSRMMELAGIQPSTTVTAIAADDAMGSLSMEPIDIDLRKAPTIDATCTPLQTSCDDQKSNPNVTDIMASFDNIEQALPELKVKDAREIRKRIYDLTAKLNESLRLK